MKAMEVLKSIAGFDSLMISDMVCRIHNWLEHAIGSDELAGENVLNFRKNCLECGENGVCSVHPMTFAFMQQVAHKLDYSGLGG